MSQKKAPRPGIEPGSSAWQAEILTTILSRKSWLLSKNSWSNSLLQLIQIADTKEQVYIGRNFQHLSQIIDNVRLYYNYIQLYSYWYVPWCLFNFDDSDDFWLIAQVVNETCVEIQSVTPSHVCIMSTESVTLHGRGFTNQLKPAKAACRFKTGQGLTLG